jgi:predicted ATPase
MVGALESAMAGESAVVIVGGEAGVGKTRLVEEAAARARDAGARVLMGSCIELGGAGLPLSPLVDAIRPLVRVMDPDELEPLPVLLIVTFRSDELHRGYSLRPLVSGWERVRSHIDGIGARGVV